jgi:hypothetical protein
MSQTRAYRSKIGRLPFALRTELNERIRDGATGTAVLNWLNDTPEMTHVRAETGCEDVNPQNLTDWRNTGYKDWLDNQEATERLRALTEMSADMVHQTGGDPSAVGARILAGKLLSALETAAPEEQGELVKAFATLRAGENDARRTDLAREKNELARQSLALDRQKFQRQTCDLYLKWYEDEQAKTIVEDKALNNDAKTEALGRLMFGQLWESK